MRKIEEQMVAAIRAGRNFSSGNTRVEIANDLGSWRVFLHGNLIANGGKESMQFTLAGWPTPTTRSRVNALLREFSVGNAGVYQHAFEQRFIQFGHFEAIASRDWVAPQASQER